MDEEYVAKLINIFDTSKTASAGWRILTVEDSSGEHHTVVGSFDDSIIDNIKMQLTFFGKWENNSTYGLQFKAKSYALIRSDVHSIQQFLTNLKIPRVGKARITKIVDYFGKDTLTVIEETPEKLTEVKTITKAMADRLHIAVCENQLEKNISQLFKGDISYNKIKKIIATYGKKAYWTIRNNPYIMMYGVDGIAFKTADKLALSMGIKLNDPRRVQACVAYTLQQAAEQAGHCYIPADDIASNVRTYIEDVTVDDYTIADAIIQLQKENKVICENAPYGVNVYLPKYFRAEMSVAKKIALMLHRPDIPIDEYHVDHMIELSEITQGVEFEKGQKEAIKTSLMKHISVITGGPGTGKSTIINAVAHIRDEDSNVILLAPTGRAARRMAETTGMEAHTIAGWTMRQPDGTILTDATIIIDEVSMVDICSIYEVMKLVAPTSSIVFVGDIDQLPPIGSGNFFRDLVTSQIVPISRLRVSHRFGGSIAYNAKAINSGSNKFQQDEHFQFISATSDEKRRQILLDTYYKKYHECGEDLRKIQIIVPMRQRGATSANALNELIREKLNPLKPGQFTIGALKLRVGDRVMQTTNNRKLGVSNGDTGIIIAVSPTEVYVKMDVFKQPIKYEKEEWNELTIAYAITVHKSQGSEYQIVLSAYCFGDYMMLQRNLLYTAVTRAKKECILIGDGRAIYKAVNNITPIVRNTALVDKIIYFLKS